MLHSMAGRLTPVGGVSTTTTIVQKGNKAFLHIPLL